MWGYDGMMGGWGDGNWWGPFDMFIGLINSSQASYGSCDPIGIPVVAQCVCRAVAPVSTFSKNAMPAARSTARNISKRSAIFPAELRSDSCSVVDGN